MPSLANTPRGSSCIGLFILGLILLPCLPVQAFEPNFDDLLARAEAEAAVGDQLSDIFYALYKLVPTATPRQLRQFSALLGRDAKPVDTLALLASPPSTDLPKPADQRPAAAAAKPRPMEAGSGLVDAPSPRAKSDDQVMQLFARGQVAENAGDISGARRFYTSAAQRGHAAAARNLGRLYDPVFLGKSSSSGIDADPDAAAHWYGVAAALGDTRAAPLLQALTAR